MSETCLKPDLHNAHVQPGLSSQLFPNVSGRFGAALVGLLQGLQTFCGNCRPGSFVAAVHFCGFWKSIFYHILTKILG